MNGLLSWKLNRDDPMANFAAGIRWATLWGIGYNIAAGHFSGNELNTLLASVWFGVYVLATQWLARITGREAEAKKRYDLGLSAWNPMWSRPQG